MEDLLRFPVVCHEYCRVPGTSALYLQGDLFSGDLLAFGEHFLDGAAFVGTQIEEVRSASVHEVLQCQYVGVRQVFDVHIVPIACAVAGVVVVAEELELLSVAEGGSEDVGDEVGLRIVPFSHPASGVRTGHVEVSQAYAPDTVGQVIVVHHPFDGEFGSAVGVDGSLGVVLVYGGVFGLAVGGGGGREYDLVNPMVLHGIEEVHRTADVVAVVDVGSFHRFGDLGEGCEMYHGTYVVLFQRPAYTVYVQKVAGERPEEPSFRRYAGDVLGSLYVTGAVVVEGQDVVSGIEEGQYTVAADVAVPSGHHDLHSKTSL